MCMFCIMSFLPTAHDFAGRAGGGNLSRLTLTLVQCPVQLIVIVICGNIG